MLDILYPKAFNFSVKIVEVYKSLVKDQKEYVLSKQLLKSGTSIGANLAEALGGISKAEFSSKISLSYKESLETKYWLDLLAETGYISTANHKKLRHECDELSRMMYAILKKTRINNPTGKAET